MNKEEQKLNEFIDKIEVCPVCKAVTNGDKFCHNCGTDLTEYQNNNSEHKIYESQEEETYIEKYDYSGMIACFTMAALLELVLFFTGHGFDFWLVIVIGLVIGCAFIRQKISFKCPNCNEEIDLLEGKIQKINDNESACVCPKCNHKLLLNNSKKTIRKNEIVVNRNLNKTTENPNTSKIEELYNLKTKGIITEEEFEKKKQELLNKI